MATPLAPPTSASQTYKSLFTTSLAFIAAQAQTPTLPSRMDFDLLRSLCTPSFQHSWGHNYAVSLAPRLQGTHSIDDFTAHLQKMLPNLESWKTDVTEVIVDEVQMKVMLRVSFWMQAKGVSESEVVENDLVWVLEMDGDGDVCRVKRSREFLDGVAAGRIKEGMMGKV